MKFKDLFGGDKEPKVKAEAETKTEPAVKAKAETKWKPKVKGKAAAKRAKRKKRFQQLFDLKGIQNGKP